MSSDQKADSVPGPEELFMKMERMTTKKLTNKCLLGYSSDSRLHYR